MDFTSSRCLGVGVAVVVGACWRRRRGFAGPFSLSAVPAAAPTSSTASALLSTETTFAASGLFERRAPLFVGSSLGLLLAAAAFAAAASVAFASSAAFCSDQVRVRMAGPAPLLVQRVDVGSALQEMFFDDDAAREGVLVIGLLLVLGCPFVHGPLLKLLR
eukprot:728246-Pleurochrysis_carterae.AAC.2